jgi:hypothetical protein
MTMKSMKIFMISFALFVSASGFSANTKPCSLSPCIKARPAPSDPCQSCPKPVMRDQGYSIHDCYKAAYNAPARIDVKCCWDFFLSADFIYWEAREKGLELGTFEYHVATKTPGNVVNLDWKYQPGFKVSLGYNSESDDWTFYAQYTFFHNMIFKELDQANLSSVISPWLLVPPFARKVLAEWKRDFDILDFECGRAFYLGKRVTIQPFFGTRAYFFQQKYTFSAASLANTIENFSSAKSWAIGGRAGIDTRWILGYGFRIFANTASDLVYQNFKTKISNFVNHLTHFTYIDNSGYIVPNFELALGLGWGSYFNGSKYHFDITAGYEFQYFWNQNMMRRLKDSAPNEQEEGKPLIADGEAGGLMLHGLTFTARFDF